MGGGISKLEYRFTVSPADVVPVVRAHNKKLIEETMRLVAIVAGAGILFSLLGSVASSGGPILFILGIITLIYGTGSLISGYFRNRERVPHFEPRAETIVVTRQTVTLKTDAASINVGSKYVQRVFTTDYGLKIFFDDANEWSIPISAFQNEEAAAEEVEKIEALLRLKPADKPEQSSVDGRQSGTIH